MRKHWEDSQVSSTGHLYLLSLTRSSSIHSYSYTVSPMLLKWLTISCFYNIYSSQLRTFLFKVGFYWWQVCVQVREEKSMYTYECRNPQSLQEDVRVPGVFMSCRIWLFGRKLGPLKEQFVLLITKVSLLIHSGASYQWCKQESVRQTLSPMGKCLQTVSSLLTWVL